jgi:hypothetical protein
MKNTITFLTLLLAALLLSGCGAFPGLILADQDVETITASDTIITETRDVAGFDKIDMSTFGKVILTQGDAEALTITGSDNIVPLIQTTVRNGTLTIQTEKNINIRNMDKENVLTLEITVVDLTGLTVSGLGDIQMDALSATGLNVVLSGAGNVTLDQLAAEILEATVSGVGNLEIAGKANECNVEIPGAGSVKAGDLECQSATVNISGVGSATVWVTGQLNGSISGAGSVSYYGNPQTDTESTGLGSFKELGGK